MRNLCKEIDIEWNFNFSPYSHTDCGLSALQCYEEDRREVKLVPPNGHAAKGSFLLAFVARALLIAKLEIKESVVSYNPQRIMRQFGFIYYD